MKQELASASRYNFQNLCFLHLKRIFPDLMQASELGEIDARGVDLYEYDAEKEELGIVFQCKGFEVPRFGKAQLGQCLKSIESLKKTATKASSYFIIVNRYIKDAEHRSDLKDALDTLVQRNIVQKAEVLDLNKFIDFLFSHYFEFIEKQIQRSNEAFRNEYIDRFDQQFYLDHVPFTLSQKKAAIHYNPISYIQTQINQVNKVYVDLAGELNENSDDLTRKSIWSFVVSEFGFGKTSLLLNLYRYQKEFDITPIYLPIAQFKTDAFTNESTLCANILDLLLDSDSDRDEGFNKLLTVAVKLLLRDRKDLLLMFDGLDEHHTVYNSEGLRRFFNCFRHFQPVCLFSARKEFWYERQGDLSFAIGSSRKYKDVLVLENWSDHEIVEYIDQSIKHGVSGDIDSIFRFREIVQNGEYEQSYGDIPKRPLFLRMLLDDIATGNTENNSLSSLYENYLLNKFRIDRETSVSNPTDGRPLEIRGDHYSQNQLLFEILSMVARRMLVTEKDKNRSEEVVYKSDLTERELKSIVKEVSTSVIDTIQILLHSVLMPFDRRSIHGFRVRFAHKSFQEYFTAYSFFMDLANLRIERDELLYRYKFSTGVHVFVCGMVDNLESGSTPRNMCVDRVQRIAQQGVPPGSLVDVLKRHLNVIDKNLNQPG